MFLFRFWEDFVWSLILCANRYWVGGGSSANWNATGNTNWGTASNTRDNASVPANNDDCIFDNSANGNSPCTVNTTTNAIKSLTFAGTAGGDYANTLSGSGTISMTTGAAGNFTFSSAMTQSWTGSLTINATSGTCTITSNTKGLLTGSLNINGVGGTTVLGDAFSSTGTINMSGGTLNTAGKAVTCTTFGSTSSANVRTLTLGNSTITLTATSNQWNMTGTGSNFTMTANTGTIAYSAAGAFTFISSSTGTNWNGLSIAHSVAQNLQFDGISTGLGTIAIVDGTSAADVMARNGASVSFNSMTYNAVDYRPFYGASWVDPVPTTPTFSGVTQVERIGGGALKVSWSAGTNLTGYRIYAKPSNATNLFTSTYLVKEVPSGVTSTILKTGADNTTFFDGTAAIYVGVRAYNDDGNCTASGTGVEDSNTTSYYITPDGTGSTYIKIPQELWSL